MNDGQPTLINQGIARQNRRIGHRDQRLRFGLIDLKGGCLTMGLKGRQILKDFKKHPTRRIVDDLSSLIPAGFVAIGAGLI